MLARYKGRKYELKGKKCILGDIKEKDLSKYVGWLRDKEVTRYLSQDNPNLTLKKEKEWYEKTKKAKNEVVFGIYALDKGKKILVGSASFLKIDNDNRNAEFGIAIGDKDYWGKGIGTETTKLIIDFGFKILGLNSVYLVVNINNKAGQKAYKRAGFKKVGIMREHVYRKKPEDSILMDMIRKEWKK